MAAVLFLCSCRPAEIIKPVVMPEPSVEGDAETELFSRAERVFRLSSYREALNLYDEYLFRFPEGQSVPAVLMRKGAIYNALGSHESAHSVYKQLLERYPDSFLVPEAKVDILAALYNEGHYEQLIEQADEVGTYVTSKAHVLKLYMLLADAYVKVDSPANAVHFYTKSLEYMRYPEKERLVIKLKAAVEQLSMEDTQFLLERVTDPLTKGYLMHRLGRKRVEEKKNEEASRVLSDFVREIPDHEKAEEAHELVAEYERMPPPPAVVYGDYTIGCLLPLSGSYEIYGNKVLNGIHLAMDQSESWQDGGSSIRLSIKDTASNPDEAVRRVRELAQENVLAIIGPIISAEAAAYEAQNNGIPIITLSQKEHIATIGEQVFRHFITPAMQVRKLVSYAVGTLRLNDFAILHPDEKYGETFMKLFWDEVVSYGGQIVSVESYQPNETDFGDPIKRLARKSRKTGFQAIFIPDAPAKAGLIIPQLAFHDISKAYLFGTNLWHSDKLATMAGKWARGAIFPDIFFPQSHSPDVRDFVRNFQETFGDPPGFIEAIAYDTAMILFQMIRKGDIQYTGDLRDKLATLRNFRGVTGLTSFDESGEAYKSLYLLRVKEGGFEELRDR